ncbi:MAG: IclR family transcriptional regulator [Thermoleophilia bacterium]|nr:IclR family transcriptional regulator [Thermoleophilia bacterium]
MSSMYPSEAGLRYNTLADFSRLLALFESPDVYELGVNEIARLLGMHPSKISRMLQTLAAEGLMERDRRTGRYRVGVRLLFLGLNSLQNHPLRRIVLPHLEQMARELELFVSWAVFSQHKVLVIDRFQVEKLPPIRLFGVDLPLHCTAYGKLFLAFLPPYEQDEVLRNLELARFTARTITTLDALREELVKTRTQGYALDEGESREDLLTIAVPIFDSRSALVAAVTAAGVPGKDPISLEQTLPYMLDKSLFISRQLGYAPVSAARL